MTEPREIFYDKENDRCITPCPNGVLLSKTPDIIKKVGSVSCRKCYYFRDINYEDHKVYCSFKEVGASLDNALDYFDKFNQIKSDDEVVDCEFEELYFCSRRMDCSLSVKCQGKEGIPERSYIMIPDTKHFCFVLNEYVTFTPKEEYYKVGDEFIDNKDGFIHELMEVESDGYIALVDKDLKIVKIGRPGLLDGLKDMKISKSMFEQCFGKGFIRIKE